MADRDRFDRFTGHARKVLSLAQEEAQRFQHNYIGTEHLLLGLVRENEGMAAKVLASLGIELAKVRAAVEFIIGRGDRIVLGEIGLTPRAKKVVELAVDEARSFNHHYIGTEHLLLGLIREGEGIGAGVLINLGLTLDQVRTTTLHILEKPGITINEEVSHLTRHLLISEEFGTYTFTDDARRIFRFAQANALLLQHSFIGAEHLLLGLVRLEEGPTAQVFAHLSIDLSTIYGVVEKITGQGQSNDPGDIPLSSVARAVIHLAADEASKLKQESIRAVHLLLGLLRVKQSVVSVILQNLDTDQDTMYTTTLQIIEQNEKD
jgi:ATP-dependent Clp protease ATP-binding subunit ClpA